MGEDIRDIKGPVTLPFEVELWMVLLLVTLLIVGAALFFLWLRKRKKEEVAIAPPLILADLEALKALDYLEEQKLPEAGKGQDFFFQLSAILRRYLERRFGVRATEQTSEEFLTQLAESDFLTEEQKKPLRSFMENADLVKFAKQDAGPKECREGDKFARQLIQETKKIIKNDLS